MFLIIFFVCKLTISLGISFYISKVYCKDNRDIWRVAKRLSISSKWPLKMLQLGSKEVNPSTTLQSRRSSICNGMLKIPENTWLSWRHTQLSHITPAYLRNCASTFIISVDPGDISMLMSVIRKHKSPACISLKLGKRKVVHSIKCAPFSICNWQIYKLYFQSVFLYFGIFNCHMCFNYICVCVSISETHYK